MSLGERVSWWSGFWGVGEDEGVGGGYVQPGSARSSLTIGSSSAWARLLAFSASSVTEPAGGGGKGEMTKRTAVPAAKPRRTKRMVVRVRLGFGGGGGVGCDGSWKYVLCGGCDCSWKYVLC